MKKSSRVTLTILAGAGCIAHAQQASNPCAPGSFDPGACKTAVKRQGYCDGSTWVPQTFQRYPYYYGAYQTYSTAGGVVTPPPPSSCRAPRTGGFGTHALAFLNHGG